MDDKKKEEILFAKYPELKIKTMSRKEAMLGEQIKEYYTNEEFKKRSDEVLSRELP